MLLHRNKTNNTKTKINIATRSIFMTNTGCSGFCFIPRRSNTTQTMSVRPWQIPSGRPGPTSPDYSTANQTSAKLSICTIDHVYPRRFKGLIFRSPVIWDYIESHKISNTHLIYVCDLQSTSLYPCYYWTCNAFKNKIIFFNGLGMQAL